MSVLNVWQRLDRVVRGKPFGNGGDGAFSSAAIPTLTKDSCSGTADSSSLTTAGSTFADGDILLIHQTRGAGVGQWEINKVASGGGTTSLTLSKTLHYTFTDSGASQAQAIKILQYTTMEQPSGTWTVPAWDGETGGIFVAAARTSVTPSGTIDVTGKGFVGGAGGLYNAGNTSGSQGEGSAGAGSVSSSANGNGGGGGGETPDAPAGWTGSAGGGGGHSATGTTAQDGESSGSLGTGGDAAGSADLSELVFGGSGGGGSGDRQSDGRVTGGSGGTSGGIFIIFSPLIDTSSATFTCNGNVGGNKTNIDGDPGNCKGAGGGGGAGGSVLLVTKNATLGSAAIVAVGGAGGSGSNSNNGGAGADGRIAVHHSGTVTGTTNPTFTDVSDATLKETSSGMFMVL